MAKTRTKKSMDVKPGHLPIAEMHSPFPAASSPFGDDLEFPLTLDKINYDHSEPVAERIDGDN